MFNRHREQMSAVIVKALNIARHVPTAPLACISQKTMLSPARAWSDAPTECWTV
jgi:hypothetical protein